MSFGGYSFIFLAILSIAITQIYGSRSRILHTDCNTASSGPEHNQGPGLNTVDDILKDQTLALHNKIRAEVGVAPLVWDDEITAHARKYADVRAKDCALVHSPDETYGENIAGGVLNPNDPLNGVLATKLWYGEKKFYNYDTNKCSDVCGHYTQVVANQTHKMGCASNRCQNGNYIWIVCNYGPRPQGDEHTRPY